MFTSINSMRTVGRGLKRHFQTFSRRQYMILSTTYNPGKDRPTLPNGLMERKSSLQPQPRSIVLLTTPDYASVLKDESGLLESHIASLLVPAAKRLHSLTEPELRENEKTVKEIEVLAAVVDDLPYLEGGSGVKATPPTQRNSGYSWLITDHEGIISPLLSASREGELQKKTTTGRNSNWGMDKPAPLIFVLPAAPGETQKTVTLPLANTLFQAASISTLVRFNVSSKDVKSPRPAEVTERPGYRIVIPVTEGAGAKQVRFASKLPLVSLTRPRKVLACAGNILRALGAPTDDEVDPKSSVPASQELEKAVHEYFARGARPPGKVDIFACITPTMPPAAITTIKGTWVHPDPWSLEVPSTVKTSPKTNLRRVLSGGGGWGNKAGLLSLDPQGWAYALEDKEYDMLHYTDDLVAEGDSEGGDFKRTFEERFFSSKDDIKDVRGSHSDSDSNSTNHTNIRNTDSIVQVGDFVQFFIVDYSTLPPGDIPEPGSLIKTLSFGCVAKEEEAGMIGQAGASKKEQEEEEEVVKQTEKDALGRPIVDVDGLFGARSEEGVWIHAVDEAEGAGAEEGRGRRGKMDVPGGEIMVELEYD